MNLSINTTRYCLRCYLKPARGSHLQFRRSGCNNQLNVFLIATILITCFVTHPLSASNCLYVSSYHPGYEWNDGIEQGIESTLGDKCNLDKFYMDTKRNPEESFSRAMAKQARNYIEQTNPDIVIACDDNASKYLVKPYYKNASRPFVFCGINWTTEEYGYPYKNATGMIEVAPIKPLLNIIKNTIANVSHGVYLSADVLTEHKDYLRYKKKYAEENVTLNGVFVKTQEEWKKAFYKAQHANFIILNNNSGINNWNNNEIQRFVAETPSVLTVTNYDWMIDYAMLAITKYPQEQGEWAAKVALAILGGESVADIPIVVNRRWNIYANMSLLKSTSYKLPSSITDKAIYRNQ